MKVCFNGDFFSADERLVTVQNRSFKWGDGLFETMKFFNGSVLLAGFHFERLFSGLKLLQIEAGQYFTAGKLNDKCIELCQYNDCTHAARIRVAVYRNEDNTAGYVIEAIALSSGLNDWQLEGQKITIFPYARKSMDAFSNIKSANFLCYVLADRYAKQNKVDDALVLNASNFLCDSSRANIFLIKNDNIFTPALHQGCVNGVMRRLVIECIKKMGYGLYQQEVKEEDLISADEVFLTNAIQMIRWVSHYHEKQYTFTQTKKIFETVTATIFQ